MHRWKICLALQDGLKKILIFSNDENPTRSNKALTDLAKQKAADLQARLARPRPSTPPGPSDAVQDGYGTCA